MGLWHEKPKHSLHKNERPVFAQVRGQRHCLIASYAICLDQIAAAYIIAKVKLLWTEVTSRSLKHVTVYMCPLISQSLYAFGVPQVQEQAFGENAEWQITPHRSCWCVVILVGIGLIMLCCRAYPWCTCCLVFRFHIHSLSPIPMSTLGSERLNKSKVFVLVSLIHYKIQNALKKKNQ